MPSLESEFFERLLLCGLKNYPDLMVDDLAPIVVATRLLLQAQDFSLHDAFAHASALTQFHDGGVFVNKHAGLQGRLPHLARIETALFEQSRVPRETAQLLTLHWLKEHKTLPSFLNGADEIVFERAIDLCETEIQLIFCLAEMGQRFRFRLPLDLKSRGLMPPVQAFLSQIESQASGLPINVELSEICVAQPIAPFFNMIFDDPASLSNAGDERSSASVCAVVTSQFSAQVNWVCQKIVELRKASQKPVSIAVVFRSFDLRMRWFEDGLTEHKLPYKISTNLPLAELPDVKTVLRKMKERLRLENAPPRQSIGAFLNDAIESVTHPQLISLLQYFERGLKGQESLIALQDFYHWFTLLMQRREVAFCSDSNADVVELVSVKKIHTKVFDFVFLVDLCQGRFPKTDRSGIPFSDAESHEINKMVGARVLPVLYEDPLEPSVVKTRLGFESMWFVDAIASARHGLFLSASTLDPNGREQALSEFMNAAIKVVGQQPVDPISFRSFKQAELGQHRAEFLQAGSFQLDPTQSSNILKRWLGLTVSHPLTPSRLEAFASCPFRALVERIFGIEDESRSKEDVDARKIGLFAHAVLEKFFKSYEPETDYQGLGPQSRQYLSQIIHENSYLLIEDDKGTDAMVRANVLWLSLLLERAISNLLKSPPLDNVQPLLFEQRLGFGESCSKVSVEKNELYLGGILDRVDEGTNAVCVVDYKMSSALSLRQKVNAKEILQTHFQLPLYLRLLWDAYPKVREKKLYAYLVSIRDGVSTQVLGKETLLELKQLITDDESENGLASSIRRVMLPILKGHFAAKANASCDYCHLKSVCRIGRVDLERGCDA